LGVGFGFFVRLGVESRQLLVARSNKLALLFHPRNHFLQLHVQLLVGLLQPLALQLVLYGFGEDLLLEIGNLAILTFDLALQLVD